MMLVQKCGLVVAAACLLFGCATTASGVSEQRADADEAWQLALNGCETVRFGQTSWAQRRRHCDPLLRERERQGEAPSDIWRQALASCGDAEHEACCLPLGYLLRAEPGREKEKRVFTSAMRRLDERTWRKADPTHCQRQGSVGACGGVSDYLALFGEAALHHDEALALQPRGL